jgi:hypothetical protein
MATYTKHTYMGMFHCGLEREFRDEKERITFDKLHHKVCLVCKNFEYERIEPHIVNYQIDVNGDSNQQIREIIEKDTKKLLDKGLGKL